VAWADKLLFLNIDLRWPEVSAERAASLGADLQLQCQSPTENKMPSSLLAAEDADMLNHPLSDRYRCPEGFFNFISVEPWSSAAGYFRFGPEAICYGRSGSGILGPSPESASYDAIRDVKMERTILRLPFDPKEVIDNLRLERYAGNSRSESRIKNLLKRLYYHVRPLTNLTIRRQVQKFNARNWRKRSFPHWPVDTTVENICETILLLSMMAQGIEKVPFVWFWPDGASGCLAMTHDVETIAGRDLCAKLMDVDDSFGMKAAFAIVPEERYEVSPNLLESIRSRGFEVAIQDLNHDGRLFDGKDEFLRRVKMINGYGREYCAKGFRAAILYRKPEWYDALEFAYDMSFPNVAHLDPQHGGCCTVMPFFIGDVLELPVTTTQDYTLFHVLNEHSIDLWKSQVDLILKKNGLISFIVHPDYIMEPGTLSVYKSLLVHLRNLRERTPIWGALPSEINAWWRARSKMSLLKHDDSWRIEGEGSERAVLAYAKNCNGKLVYEVPSAMRIQ
jgi:hypothetical protein